MLKKLSLAAIIAVSGVSFASATPLTDAIKNVDLSGMIRFRFYHESDKSYSTRWRTSSDFKFTIPVSEELKLTYKLGVEGNIYNKAVSGKTTVYDPTVNENLVFFTYKNNGLTALVGKIPVATPVTGSGHGEAHGAGAIALYNVNENFTVAAAGIDNITNVDAVSQANGGKNIYAVAGIYGQDNVKAQLWYFNVKDIIKSDIVAMVTYKMDNIIAKVDFATAKLDNTISNKTQTYFNISAKYAADGMCAKVGYAQTGKDGGTVVLDNDAPIAAVLPTAQVYAITNTTDTTALYAKVGTKLENGLSPYAAISYVDNKGADDKATEIQLGAKYKYTKKLGIHVYYSMLNGDKETTYSDNNEFRFEAKYSF
ncbi:porin [Caminibacter mediatlanticus TB-2]|uniref:Porin n=1 Tax=Caminibacter mediatlanticus TB-2 TaxID=391592 RepID=A0ABX5VA32_9BACT|nr:major outer membrane protein [Caminibacter mediatlanticus]QCT94227.1 porin [Caminibacter mediatlanticus TB-2]